MILVESNKTYIPIELNIMNSHPEHNLISDGKEILTEQDMLEEHEEGKELDKERYLVKVKNDFIGIIDFIMENPRDQKPWLGLFIIHQDWVGKEYTKQAYLLYEDLMKSREVNTVRLGCFKGNTRGMNFWKKQGFTEVKEIEYKGKPMFIMEKGFE